jgi:hypothetical protein
MMQQMPYQDSSQPGKCELQKQKQLHLCQQQQASVSQAEQQLSQQDGSDYVVAVVVVPS